MSNQTNWKPLGNYDKNSRVSIAVAAIAVIFALETFLNPAGNYEPFMSFLAFAAGGVAAYRAFKTKAYLGFLALPLALVWLNPLLGGNWFDSVSQVHFAAHSAFAMLFAIYAYTFMRMNVSKPNG
ncbi:MAG: hypothetical protein RIR24_288 [Actinomycetota bacterium]|jgi:hypothetical protein